MPGTIYPIHPSAPRKSKGCKAYPSLGQHAASRSTMPMSLSAPSAFPMPSPQANGRCRIAQVISSGFAEVEEGRGLER